MFADPDKGHSLSDLVARTRTSMPTVLREVGRAEQAGLLITEKVGSSRQVRANEALEPDEVEEGFILTCQSVPDTDAVVDYDSL